MAKFNKKSSGSNLTTNFVSGIAYKITDPKLKLYSIACTRLFGEKKYYEYDTDDDILGLINKIVVDNPEFPLKLAAYIRSDLYLRTTPLVILGYCSLIKECQPYIRRYTNLIIQRADEMAEVIAIVKHFNGDIGNKKPSGSLPSALKTGIKDRFNTFNKYRLTKYLGVNDQVKLSDVIKIVHPKPKDEEQSKLYKDILNNSITTPEETWEHYISVHGSTTENWEKIIPEMPIMALLRGLNNFLINNVSTDILNNHVIKKLTDTNTILNSKQFPFRFWSAYNKISENTNPNTRLIMDALETAMDISVDNLPKLSGITAVMVDHSGSMSYPSISKKSNIKPRDIGDMLVGIADRICEQALPCVFSDDIKIVNTLSKRAGVLNNKALIDNIYTGNGNYYPIFTKFLEDKIFVDRFIVFTDEEIYTTLDQFGQPVSPKSVLAKYRKEVNPDVKVYMINLVGYSTTIVDTLSDPRNLLLTGWNEKIFDYINRYEEDKTKILQIIEDKYTINNNINNNNNNNHGQ